MAVKKLCPGTIDWECKLPAKHKGEHEPGRLKGATGSVPDFKNSWAAPEKAKTEYKYESPKKDAKKQTLNALSIVPLKQGEAGKERGLCNHCALHETCASAFVRPFIPQDWTRKLLVVVEAPLDGDSPWAEAEGRLLRRLMKEAGYEREDVAIAFALRCGGSDHKVQGDRPPAWARSETKRPTMAQIRMCRPFLLGVLQRWQPKGVLAMGDSAARAILNRTAPALVHLRGRKLEVAGVAAMKFDVGLPAAASYVPTVYATYDTATLLDEGNAHLREYVVADMKRFDLPVLSYPKLREPNDDVVSVDTEYVGDKLLTLGLADTKYAIAADVGTKEFEALKERLKEPFTARVLLGHSVDGDVDQIVALGLGREEWVSGQKVRDSLLLAKFVDENRGMVSGQEVRGTFKLDNLLLSEKNVEPWKEDTQKILDDGGTAAEWTPEQRAQRCRLDAWASAVLAEHFKPNLPRREYVEFVHRVAMSLHRIYLAGAFVDMKALHGMGKRLQAEANRTKELLERAAAKHRIEEFVPTNTDHLRVLLFKKLKLKPLAKTSTGLPQVDKTLLKEYAHVPEVKHLVEFKKSHKMLSTWYGSEDRKTTAPPLIDTVERVTDDLGLLRFRLRAHGARTARRSSGRDDADSMSATNSQNWPKEARRIIRSRWPKGLVLNADYKSLEVVLIAWQARDEKLFEYFTHPKKSGYLLVAKELLGKEYEKGTIEYRVVKEAVLGSNYRMRAPKMAWKLWYQLQVRLAKKYDEHERKTAAILERYHEKFPRLRRYQEERVREVLETQQIVCETGYVRHLPCPEGRDTPGFWHTANEAANVRTQHLASAVTGSALIDIESTLLKEHKMSLVDYHAALLKRDWPKFALPINEVHDSLVNDLHPRSAKRDEEIIVETMRAVPTLRALVPKFKIPLGVDVARGPVWAAE
jgi:uracil-DNA glycosylase family 4